MTFELPKTLEQMYETLDSIFHYYRLTKGDYTQVVLPELKLDRLNVTFDDDAGLRSKAETMVLPDQLREQNEYEQDLNDQIAEIDQKIELEQINAQSEIDEVNRIYDESIGKIQQQVSSSGLNYSSVAIDKTTSLEEGRNQKIVQINSKCNDILATLYARRRVVENRLSQASTHFTNAHLKDVDKKFLELKNEQMKLQNEVFKYNVSLDEKEQKYANGIKKAEASLTLQYLQITVAEFSKSQLIDMGYYADIIRCICGYFDTLAPSTAYDLFRSENKVAVYLEEYYQQILYMYKINAVN
jgi:hypothetical protein